MLLERGADPKLGKSVPRRSIASARCDATKVGRTDNRETRVIARVGEAVSGDPLTTSIFCSNLKADSVFRERIAAGGSELIAPGALSECQ